jgi:hypothetical protein
VHRIRPGPVLQYRPLKPTAPDTCSDRASVVTTRRRVLVPADRCHLPSRPPHAAHAAATRVQRLYPAPGRWPRACDSCAAARHLKAMLSANHCRPVATSAPRAAHAATARRRSRSLLFPQLLSSSCHSARARHCHRSLATIDRHLWCSAGPIHSTRSVARARRCSPTSPTKPTTISRPPHRCIPPPDYHHCREPATVSLLSPFTPNRDHRQSGLLPACFPADQRLPAGRIRPVSHRRRGGIFPPLFA